MRRYSDGMIQAPDSSDAYSEVKEDPVVLSLHIESDIRARFATTRIAYVVANPHSVSVHAHFSVRLPDAAFITEFTLTLPDRVIKGEVKEAAKATAEYVAAAAWGETAGLVAAVRRETSVFRTSVALAPNTNATFHLTYQEILTRTHGLYKHTLCINPGQVIDDVGIEVHVLESEAIIGEHVPKPAHKLGMQTNYELMKLAPANNVKLTRYNTPEGSSLHLSYQMTRVEQWDGSEKELVLLYDVERPKEGGELQVLDGYFLHFFAPNKLPTLPKQIVFIIDKSGSMEGRKMKQTKEAMKVILSEMTSEDVFNVIAFSTDVVHWNKKRLVAKASELGGGRTTMHTIAFGRGADYDLLVRLAENHHGLARKIYEDSDASLQLQGFYKEISKLVLSNVRFSYVKGSVDPETLVTGLVTADNNYYEGWEVMTVGQLDEEAVSKNGGLSVSVEAKSGVGRKKFQAFSPSHQDTGYIGPEQSENSVGGRLERMWAYLTIKKLIHQASFSDVSAEEKNNIEHRALQLSLKYSFVTELTSMAIDVNQCLANEVWVELFQNIFSNVPCGVVEI